MKGRGQVAAAPFLNAFGYFAGVVSDLLFQGRIGAGSSFRPRATSAL
jgi:hypothetical protein